MTPLHPEGQEVTLRSLGQPSQQRKTVSCPAHPFNAAVLFLFGRQSGLCSLFSGCGDTVRTRQWSMDVQEKGENTSSPSLPRPSRPSIEHLGHTTEEVQGKKKKQNSYSCLVFHPACPLLEGSELSFRISVISPVTDKALHCDSLFQSITLHRPKLTGFYCLSACRGFPALCNNCYSKENYLPNLQKEFYSPLRSAESQQSL